MIEQSIEQVLSAVAPTFPVTAEESQQAPYIIYQNIANSPEVTLDNSIPVNNTRIQIDCYATTYLAAKTLAAQIQVAMAAAPFTNVPRQSRDGYEAAVKLFRVSADYSIWF